MTDDLPPPAARCLYHLVEASALRRLRTAEGYAPDSLTSEGFVHCATAGQLERVAEQLRERHAALALLVIDPEQLTSEVRLEGADERFPHVYGPIDDGAIVEVRDYPAKGTGKGP